MRVKTSVPSRAKHKKLKSAVQGYRGVRKHSIKLARQAMLKAGVYSYRDRRVKKGDFRSQWIVVINAALNSYDLSYSVFINKLSKANINIDRKILAETAKTQPEIFKSIVNKVK